MTQNQGNNYSPVVAHPAVAPTPTVTPSSTASPTPSPTPPMNASPTLNVQTFVPPATNFVTPTHIPGATDAAYCYQGATIPVGYTCVNPSTDTQEEIIAQVLVGESQGAPASTMANVAGVIWQLRGDDSVGGAQNPATIVQRTAGVVGGINKVTSVRQVKFAGILKPVDRNSDAYKAALVYANALMQAHVQWSKCSDDNCRGQVKPAWPQPGPNSLIASKNVRGYCAVSADKVKALANQKVLAFSEETSPGTYHAYVTQPACPLQ